MEVSAQAGGDADWDTRSEEPADTLCRAWYAGIADSHLGATAVALDKREGRDTGSGRRAGNRYRPPVFTIHVRSSWFYWPPIEGGEVSDLMWCCGFTNGCRFCD